ncbi:MAG: sugar ABC transporter ATP-binding protein [Chloroflexi bacterium]|nr:sugar ABC transporter ATP-binding protein [Chloroflexota bacterium]
MNSSEPLLAMRGISKTFPGVDALDGVDLDVRRGEVHVLLGENGAGKSTLIKILAGVYRPDYGSITFKGQPALFDSPRDSQRAGISVIYQERSLVRELSVMENIFLGDEPQRLPGLPFVDQKRMSEGAGELLDRLNLPIDPAARVQELTSAEQHMVEVARALHHSADLIIMDEPTAYLTSREVADLFNVIRTLRAQGVAVIYVSHRLEEVMQIGDRATVLRDGRKIDTVSLAGSSLDDLIQMIVGRYVDEKFPRDAVPIGPEVLRVEGLTRHGAIEDVSFTLHAGEIMGIAGLLGAGGIALVRAIFGADPLDAGAIFVDGQPVRIDSPQVAIALGIGLLTEDRHEQGLVLDMSAQENMTLAALESAWPGPFIDHAAEEHIGAKYAGRLGIRLEQLLQQAAFLSGGTQQKIVLSRWLATRSRVLIFDEPTRGIDVGARVEIYRLMNEFARQGAAIVVVSSDLSEILGMCDNILVLCQGRVAAHLPRSEATKQSILAYASGGGPG